MALIKCPECDREISDKAVYCPGCGCPASEFHHPKEETEEDVICPFCNEELVVEDGYCSACGMRITSYREKSEAVIIEDSDQSEEEFYGVYKRTIFGGVQRVYCPRCSSENCSHYYNQKFIPGKIKTSYTANLNPFRPFTLINKKEKIIKQEKMVTEHKFMCNECGQIFS